MKLMIAGSRSIEEFDFSPYITEEVELIITGGAKGVGLATTKAVVWSFISVVVLDMVFAILFFF